MGKISREIVTELHSGPIEVRGHETPDEFGQANVTIAFCNEAELGTCYWRMIGNDDTVLSSFDHKQQYGLSEPIDAKKLLGQFLNGQSVTEVEIDRKARDLHLYFENGTVLQIFGFTSYEIWGIHFPDGAVEYSNHL